MTNGQQHRNKCQTLAHVTPQYQMMKILRVDEHSKSVRKNWPAHVRDDTYVTRRLTIYYRSITQINFNWIFAHILCDLAKETKKREKQQQTVNTKVLKKKSPLFRKIQNNTGFIRHNTTRIRNDVLPDKQIFQWERHRERWRERNVQRTQGRMIDTIEHKYGERVRMCVKCHNW